MSVYEQIAWESLRELEFEYNKAIATKSVKHEMIGYNIPSNYKPDFVHEKKKLCIEIDGHNHENKYQKELDNKKELCLKLLGYRIIRFTHKDIDAGKLGEFIKQWQN